MSTTVTHQSAPIFPAALSPDPDDATIPDIVREEHHSFNVKRAHGQCAPFCANDHVPTSGATVAEHGEMCKSYPVLTIADMTNASGRRGAIFGSLAVPYLHGIYPGLEWAHTERHGYVELSIDLPTVDGWAEGELYLTAAQARTIAASLTYLADELERPHEPLGMERARREAQDAAGREAQA